MRGPPFIVPFLGRKQAGYGSRLNSSSSRWLDPIRTTKWVTGKRKLPVFSDIHLDLVRYADDHLV